MDVLELKKEISEKWQTMVKDMTQVLDLMQSLGDDRNIKAIAKEGYCAGVLRFQAQMRNYCERYRREYLEELARSLE